MAPSIAGDLVGDFFAIIPVCWHVGHDYDRGAELVIIMADIADVV